MFDHNELLVEEQQIKDVGAKLDVLVNQLELCDNLMKLDADSIDEGMYKAVTSPLTEMFGVEAFDKPKGDIMKRLREIVKAIRRYMRKLMIKGKQLFLSMRVRSARYGEICDKLKQRVLAIPADATPAKTTDVHGIRFLSLRGKIKPELLGDFYATLVEWRELDRIDEDIDRIVGMYVKHNQGEVATQDALELYVKLSTRIRDALRLSKFAPAGKGKRIATRRVIGDYEARLTEFGDVPVRSLSFRIEPGKTTSKYPNKAPLPPLKRDEMFASIENIRSIAAETSRYDPTIFVRNLENLEDLLDVLAKRQVKGEWGLSTKDFTVLRQYVDLFRQLHTESALYASKVMGAWQGYVSTSIDAYG